MLLTKGDSKLEKDTACAFAVCYEQNVKYGNPGIWVTVTRLYQTLLSYRLNRSHKAITFECAQ